VEHNYSSSIREPEAGIRELKASLEYTARPCLKKRTRDLAQVEERLPSSARLSVGERDGWQMFRLIPQPWKCEISRRWYD
jgi:hypothetical protein